MSSQRRTGESDLSTTVYAPLEVEIHSHTVELEADDPNKAASEGGTLT
ncbi:hypothetical protein ACQPXH_22295 [Nocardia sp. CA-135953]